MSKPYEIRFEIAGPAAMFTRPDAGSTPVSYPVPTFSAVKGMFDAILRRPHIHVQSTRIEICKPIRCERVCDELRRAFTKPRPDNGK